MDNVSCRRMTPLLGYIECGSLVTLLAILVCHLYCLTYLEPHKPYF
jgi:hypothetical protein